MTEWEFHPIAVRLNQLYDQLNAVFFANALPRAVIAIGPDLITRYGYYRLGRDDIGARHRIHLNTRHFGRPESAVAVTLLHEMIHLYQDKYCRPAHRARYHNKQFVQMAAERGIHSQLGSGRTISVHPSLQVRLAVMGFSAFRPMLAGADDSAIAKPLRKVMWHCTCGQEFWADRGIVVSATCGRCRSAFEYGDSQTAVAINGTHGAVYTPPANPMCPDGQKVG